MVDVYGQLVGKQKNRPMDANGNRGWKMLIYVIYHGTRWAPTSYRLSYNPYKWPYKWVTGVITLLIGVIIQFITGRGPPCTIHKKITLSKPIQVGPVFDATCWCVCFFSAEVDGTMLYGQVFFWKLKDKPLLCCVKGTHFPQISPDFWFFPASDVFSWCFRCFPLCCGILRKSEWRGIYSKKISFTDPNINQLTCNDWSIQHGMKRLNLCSLTMSSTWSVFRTRGFKHCSRYPKASDRDMRENSFRINLKSSKPFDSVMPIAEIWLLIKFSILLYPVKFCKSANETVSNAPHGLIIGS